jgi:hypothetical protein
VAPAQPASGANEATRLSGGLLELADDSPGPLCWTHSALWSPIRLCLRVVVTLTAREDDGAGVKQPAGSTRFIRARGAERWPREGSPLQPSRRGHRGTRGRAACYTRARTGPPGSTDGSLDSVDGPVADFASRHRYDRVADPSLGARGGLRAARRRPACAGALKAGNSTARKGTTTPLQ